jgi:hypothetical protein
MAHSRSSSDSGLRCCVRQPGRSCPARLQAALDGLIGFESDVVHVTMPPGRRPRALAGADYHWSSRLESDDVHPLRQPPRTRIQRSILDMASSLPLDRLARAVILAAVQQRLVNPSQLFEALHRRGPCARRALIGESIADAGGGIASVPEKDFDAIVRRFGLPAPARQQWFSEVGDAATWTWIGTGTASASKSRERITSKFSVLTQTSTGTTRSRARGAAC